MITIALIDIKWWFRLVWPAYFAGLAMLLIVEIMGHVGMGAQRWINLGFMKLQPSEMMKIAVVMALARYFHAATVEDMRRVFFLIIPTMIIMVPVGLVSAPAGFGNLTDDRDGRRGDVLHCWSIYMAVHRRCSSSGGCCAARFSILGCMSIKRNVC